MEIVYSRKKQFEIDKQFKALSDHLVSEEERNYNQRKGETYKEIPKENNSCLKIVGGKYCEINQDQIVKLVSETTKSF